MATWYGGPLACGGKYYYPPTDECVFYSYYSGDWIDFKYKLANKTSRHVMTQLDCNGFLVTGKL